MKMTMNKQKAIFIIAAVAAAVGLAATTTVATSNPAYAAIFSVNIGCTNPN
jgi:hypothetical protein